jgi:putative zinc finger/helix-turn-helix YgiT family protein
MKCLQCSGTDFTLEKTRLSSKIKNQLVEVIVPCDVCKRCHTPLMDTQQMNLLRKAASDKYRQDHGLLTSEQIISFRKSLNLSQPAFANHLNVGEASVRRWESYYIQDASQDDHIRIKCDLLVARDNYKELLTLYDEPNKYNGNKKFSLNLFRNTALYFQNKLAQCYPDLNKLHFYVDFFHFNQHKESLTGAKYISLRTGPCPYEFVASRTHERFPYKSTDPYDPALFDSHESETLEMICSFYKKYGSAKFGDLCREEKAYQSTTDFDFISYNSAKNFSLLEPV